VDAAERLATLHDRRPVRSSVEFEACAEQLSDTVLRFLSRWSTDAAMRRGHLDGDLVVELTAASDRMLLARGWRPELVLGD
jgi:hypothetical protein